MRYLEKSPLVTHGRGWGVPWFLFLTSSGYSSPSLLRLWISCSLLDIHTWSVSIAQFYPSVLVTFAHGQASLMEMKPFVEPPTPMLLLASLLLAATLLGSSFTTQCPLYFLFSTQLIFKCSCQAAWLLNPMLHCHPQPALTSLKCWPPLTQLSFCAYFPTCPAPCCFLTMCIWLVFVSCFFYGPPLGNAIYWCSCLVCGPLSSKSYLFPRLQSSSIC